MTKPKPILHFGILAALLALTLIRAILWTTHNNKLHDMGLGNAVGLDMTLGALLAGGLAVMSIIYRKQAPSKWVFYASQVLGWAGSVGVWAAILFSGFYAILSGQF